MTGSRFPGRSGPPSTPTSASTASTTTESMRSPDTWLRTAATAGCSFQEYYPRLEEVGCPRHLPLRNVDVYGTIMDMEYAGFPVDTSNMDIVRDDLLTQQAKIKEEAWSLAGDCISPFPTPMPSAGCMFGEGKRRARYEQACAQVSEVSRCSAVPRLVLFHR